MFQKKISKTKLKRHLRMKTNPELVETIKLASKSAPWQAIAKRLAASTRKQSSVNLMEIDKKTTAGDTVIILGKVLGFGELTKKVRICALSMSHSAKEKLKNTKSEGVSVLDEIKKNPKAEGIKIIP